MGEPQLNVEPSANETALTPSSLEGFRHAVMGYNHQIPHQGRIFHVQTEDSGPSKRHIFTHVFLSGTIVASSRIDYDGELPSPDISELLKQSHKSMLHRLVRGLIDDKIARCLDAAGACAQSPPEGRPMLEVVPPPVEDVEATAFDDIGCGRDNPSPRVLPDSAILEGLNDALHELEIAIAGTLGIALVDYETGTCIGTAGTGIDLAVAATGSMKVMRAHNEVTRALGSETALEDMLVTAGKQCHIMRPVSS